MYKKDFREALKRVRLVSGGPIMGLLDQAKAAQGALKVALAEVAANNDASVRAGRDRVQGAVRPIVKRVSEFSPSGTVIEIHQLGAKFDSVFIDFPELESFFRPGRQILATLAGAFDVVMQQNKSPPVIIDLIEPSLLLANCYMHYAALEEVLNGAAEEASARDTLAIVEISGAENLSDFAAYVGFLSRLAEVAKSLADAVGGPSDSGGEILIAGIESGSPIQITLTGGAKMLRLLLTMLQDIIRVPYQHLTAHGRVIQAMETFSEARRLGIESGEVLSQLEGAMLKAARLYSESVDSHGVTVKVNGQLVSQNTASSIPLISPISDGHDTEVRKLSGPEEKS